MKITAKIDIIYIILPVKIKSFSINFDESVQLSQKLVQKAF